MNRTVVLTVLLALTVALAGCGGDAVGNGANGNGGGNGNGNSGGNGDAGGNGDSAGNGDAGSGNGGGTGSGEIDFFEFDSPGTYVFDVEMDGDTGEVTWDIQSIDGETLTVYVDYAVGEADFETTITGTREDIQGQLLFTPAGSFMMLAVFSPMYGYYDGEEMYVGKEWSFTAPDGSGSMSFEITETRTYAGVSCFASELRINDTTVQEACFSPDLGLAAYTAWYEEDTGDVEMRMELIEYSRD